MEDTSGTLRTSTGKIKLFRIIASVILSGILSFGLCIVGQFLFLEPDDTLLSWCVEGAYGVENSEYLVFSNIILGWAMKIIARLLPNLNAYAICLMGIEMISFAVLYLAMWRRYKKRSLIILFAIIEALLSANFTYTILAAVVTVIGIILMQQPCNKTERIFGLVFTWTGFLIRIPAFAVGVGLGAVLCVADYCKKNHRKKLIQNVVILFAACTVAVGINSAAYGKDPQYALQQQRLQYRLMDYHIIDYESHASEFAEIGWSKNDWDCYYSWAFADSDTFSIEKLSQVEELDSFSNRYELSPLVLIEKMLTNKYNYMFALFMVIIFFPYLKQMFFEKEKMRMWEIWLTVIFTYGIVLLLYVRQRANQNVVLMVLFSSASVLIYLLGSMRATGTKGTISLIFAGAFALSLLCVRYDADRNTYYRATQNTAEVLAWQQENTDRFLVTTTGIISDFYKVPMFPGMADDFVLARQKLGSWDFQSRRWCDQLNAYGIDPDHLITEIATNDKIDFIADSQQMLDKVCTYLKEHLQLKDVELHVVTVLPNTGRTIYHIEGKS